MGTIVLTGLEPGLVTPAASWLSASFQSDDGVNQLGISEFKVSEAEWLNLEELAAANSLAFCPRLTSTEGQGALRSLVVCARGARKPSVVLGNSDCWMDRATFISCSRRSSSRCVSASRNAALTCLRMVMGAASDDLITKLSRNAPRIAPRLSPTVDPSARKHHNETQ